MSYFFFTGVVTIGRALDNRLVVNNPIASSHHAQIRPSHQSFSHPLLALK
ncbi:MAG: FHA domain-containing protein [Ktedonobacteraceae bacterium]